MIAPTPLLDSFKRSDVARDVRLMAAQGALETRAYEQLAILMLLLEDPDAEIRATADETLTRIPAAVLGVFLSRPDVPVDMREFFADRGVFADDLPEIVLDVDEEVNDAPIIELHDAAEEPIDEGEDRETASQKLVKMGFSERLKAAVRGSREMRGILIRDSNKMIAAAVLSSPKMSGPEIEGYARMASMSEDVLRTIGGNRAWTKSYNVVLGLTKNPKTPLAMSMQFVPRLKARDLQQLAVDRNVPEPLRIAARKRVVANTSGKGGG